MASRFKPITDILSGRFSLSDIPGFPFETYASQQAMYMECDNWITGRALEDQPTTSGAATDLYPLRINPLISTVLKHAYTLFGETIHDGRPLVYPKMIPDGNTEAAIKIAEEAVNALNHLWWENNGRALMLENGILSQVYGGCIFKATYVPWEWDKYGGWRKYPIRIERIHPKSFIGRPNAGDMYRLKEGWIIGEIPYEEAKAWGYSGYDNNPTFVEYWSETEHKTWINRQEIEFPIAEPDMDSPSPDKQNNSRNPFGFVPIVYIPHIRAGGFYGMNAIDHLKGLVKELNLRYGDYGDAVNDDSHVPLAMRNVNGSPMLKRIADGIKVLDLGSSANVTGTEAQPDIYEVHKTRASTAMKDLIDQIISQYRRDSFVPSVAEGEDEGSQRSALTLATRFWPLTSHVGLERIYFGAGLDVLESYMLKILAIKNVEGITEKHTKMRIKQSWAPMLPRDREAEVQEWASRAQNDLGSIEHLIELTRDVDNVPQEIEKIKQWKKDIAKIQSDAQAEARESFMQQNPVQEFNDPLKKQGGDPKKPEKTIAEKRGGGGGKE